MKDNKQIVSMCKNFYKIVEFEPFEGDNVTDKLIRVYQNYIFGIDINNEEDVKSVIKLDKIIGKYIDDYAFRKEFQKEIVKVKIRKDSKNILRDFIESIFRIFNSYEEFTTRVITISHWI